MLKELKDVSPLVSSKLYTGEGNDYDLCHKSEDSG
jgi:hypothetical protein